MRRSTTSWICACVMLALIDIGCFRHEQKTGSGPGEFGGEQAANGMNLPPKMQVRLEASRVLDTAYTADVTGSGVPMTFVLSIDTTLPHPFGTSIDRVQAFAWNGQDSAWHEATSDTFAATSAAMRDITGDGKPDMVIVTTSGLDDSLASVGCIIHTAHTGTWTKAFVAQTGNPLLQDIDNNGAQEILIHDSYAGVMPQIDAIEYVAEIYSYDGTAFTAARKRFPKFYEGLIAQSQEQYARIKTHVPVSAPITDEFDFTLYRPLAAVFVSYHAAENLAAAREFWNREREYLSRMLPSGQFIDLEAYAGN